MSICEGCHAGCCRAFAVPVSGADILRITRREEMDFWDFVCRWADPTGSISRNHAPVFHFDDEPETPFVICLKHSPSELFPGASRCHFLEELSPTAFSPRGEGQCGIYHNRPDACRVFPASLKEEAGLAILYDVPRNGRAGNEPAYQLCHRPWVKEDVDPVDIVQDLVVARFEMEFFGVLASSWNQNPGPWKAFPDFLEHVYSQRVQGLSAAELAAQSPRPMRRAA
jgi:Fe-S-cluster containining protein